jgi:hypothetical protein
MTIDPRGSLGHVVRDELYDIRRYRFVISD